MSAATYQKLQQSLVNQTCDKSDCPAAAAVAVQFVSGGILVFCGHHFDSQLFGYYRVIQGLTILDSRKLVTA